LEQTPSWRMRMPLETGSAASPVRRRSSCDVEIIYDKYSTGSWVGHTQQTRMVGDFWRGSRRMGGASRSISGVEQTLAGPSNGGSSYICLGKTA